MSYTVRGIDIPHAFGSKSISVLSVCVLAAFWSSVVLQSVGVVLPWIRAVTGTIAVIVLPGLLLSKLLLLRENCARDPSFGEILTFSVGISLASVSIFVVAVSLVLREFGVVRPLDTEPFAAALTVLTLVLLAAVQWTGRSEQDIRFVVPNSLWAVFSLTALPILAILAAWLWSRSGDVTGMFLLVAVVVVVVFAATTRYVSNRNYPAVVWGVTIATLLHRNLLTSGVVGADIQRLYFVSQFVHSAGRWGPSVGGSGLSVTAVTVSPAAIANVTGLEVAAVFKVVYVLLYSFTPLGVYYLGRELFDADVGLYGASFFLFYHFSFYFTPGKQLISGLFVVLLLLLFFCFGIDTVGEKTAAILLAAGLVLSHYGTTYIFGLSLLGSVVGLAVVRRVLGDVDHDLRFAYPITFLGGATAWYVYSSSELTYRLTQVPLGIVDQLNSILAGTAVGSGATIVAAQQAPIQELRVYVYVIFTVLLCVGLAFLVLVQAHDIYRGDAVPNVEYTAIAVPLFVFLGSSYFVIANLYADRAYQMVLPVLAILVPVGASVLRDRVPLPRLSIRGVPKAPIFTVLLVGLFVLNTGMAAAALGQSVTDYTFDPNAHDYAFSEEERAAADWLETRPEIRRVGYLTDTPAPQADTVPIYTDARTQQMLRAAIPPGYYNVELVQIKNEWHPTFEEDRVEGGYVVLRKRAIKQSGPDGKVGTAYLSRENVSVILENRTIVYSNEDILIAAPPNGTSSADEPRGSERD